MATHTFKSTAESDFHEYDGPVTVIRPLDPEIPSDSYDAEVGPMFWVQTESGVTFHAFGDELTSIEAEVEETIVDNAVIEAAFQNARNIVGNVIVPDEHDPRL